MGKLRNLVGDLAILEEIYEAFEPAYIKGLENADSLHKTYVPIDIRDVAKRLGMNEHILFGRLRYHLDQKYRYTNADGSLVHLFCLEVGGERHCIHFPYLAGIVSERQREMRRFMIPFTLSVIALMCSVTVPFIIKMYFK